MPGAVFVHADPDAGWKEVGLYLLVDALAYAGWREDSHHSTGSLSKGRTVEELRAEKDGVVDPNEAVALVKKGSSLPLPPLCGGCPPELAWTYRRRVVDDVVPALAGSSS
jgi:hypothetical protein